MYNFNPQTPPIPAFETRSRTYMEDMAFEAAYYVRGLTQEERQKVLDCHEAFLGKDFEKFEALAKESFAICDGSPVFFVMVVLNIFFGDVPPLINFFHKAYFVTTGNRLESKVCYLVAWGFNIRIETTRTREKEQVKVSTPLEKTSQPQVPAKVCTKIPYGYAQGIKSADEMLIQDPATCEALYQAYRRILSGDDVWATSEDVWKSSLIEAFAHKPYKYIAVLLKKLPEDEQIVTVVVNFLYAALSEGNQLNLSHFNTTVELMGKLPPRKRVFLADLRKTEV